MTPESHKYAAAAGSFCFVTTENGDQQDICKLITMPCVPRLLYLNERTNNFGNIKLKFPRKLMVKQETCWNPAWLLAEEQQDQEPRARKEAAAQQVRGYCKQFAEAKHLEYKSWVDNEIFDLIDITKVKPRKYVTG